jgi:negative regulator of flagellin synthesis FlgM
MKIDNRFTAPGTGAIPDDTERPSKKTASDATPAPQGATVQISSVSSQLHAIEQGFADTPVVDSARVAELKQAISDGHFKVDAGKVADRLLSTVRELIQAHKA